MATILVVDDYELRDSLVYWLKYSMEEKHTFLEAATAEEALSVYGKRHDEIDLVITEIFSPCGRVGGQEMINQMLKLKPDAAIIVLGTIVSQSEYDSINGARYVFAKSDLKIGALTTAAKECLGYRTSPGALQAQ